MIKQGKDVEPQLGEDNDYALSVYEAYVHSDAFKELDPQQQMALLILRDKTLIQKRTLESANLNQSGVFDQMMGPMGPNGQPPQPSVTATRNPSQRFNTMKVGEGSVSAMQNTKNGYGQ
jgi:hypothetical protein